MKSIVKPLPLVAERGHRPVAGDEADVVAIGPQTPGDRRDQRVEVAARKVGAADRSLEQHVADEGDPQVRIDEDHVAGRVPGAMPHRERDVADADRVAVLEPAVGFEPPGAGNAERGALRAELIEMAFVLWGV